jgi:hypothetical protein
MTCNINKEKKLQGKSQRAKRQAIDANNRKAAGTAALQHYLVGNSEENSQ